ncbi:TPA_asm: anti-CRISPR protein AcrIIA3 [Listeria monocytogenes]|uniref:anti-CRISPR protein AcrIIA3 n=1 Tax=Listeria monocytogenes TaxID=1639 RepID=UPI0012A8C3DC|nr:anti-CRISPR protein AcrIIA3 [Listeria monocytogenes]MBW5774895.1 anti-CRISPR protein AcrIIA3 [Listeria monocytogenes]NVT47876.1 anti-CRISPR protein AcrIIA3 [Listeria monocytogenes]QGK57293.1 anti-CRISPR protein AcrIIA3 [Listeria monocytogenes]HAC1304420.1 anti-CRISPR protein AcrIIA3 [Listeria monocytogenes]HAC1516273.1 anti-CRISPR protein AcrIIA3 [Listeria monocytogenes]
MYNKAEIMSQAWEWFTDSSIWLADIEWTTFGDTEKTFSVCLKASWAKAKEEVAEAKKEMKYIDKSEEVKAWDWAERKLDLHFEISNEEKYRGVSEEQKNNFDLNVWACAMKAVKLHDELFNRVVA